jgi:hypothetical protein
MRRGSALGVLLLGLLAGVLLAPSASSAPATGGDRCREVKYTAPGVGPWNGVGPAYAVVAHNMSCAKARRKILGWLKRADFPQDQFGWFCQATGNRMLCSGGNGGGAPFVTFRLVPAGTQAEGGLIDEGAYPDVLGTYTFAGCDEWPQRVANRRICRTRIQVFDEATDDWSVMVELWWGGRLRAVCFDANTAANPAPGFCRPKARNGVPVKLFIVETHMPVWKACWERRKGAIVPARQANQQVCDTPGQLRGKRVNYWGGPGRIWNAPPGDGPTLGTGGWGYGTFMARA